MLKVTLGEYVAAEVDEFVEGWLKAADSLPGNRAQDEPPFKTAEELGLTPDYYKGLLEVLKRLESGWFTHVPAADYSGIWYTPRNKAVVDAGPHGFSMGTVWKQDSCGTVGCILGWAQAFSGGGVQDNPIAAEQTTLWGCHAVLELAHDALTMPPGWNKEWGRKRYTPERAAHALRSYLLTGQADWQLED